MRNKDFNYLKACLFALPIIAASLSSQAEECDAVRTNVAGAEECWIYNDTPSVLEVTEHGKVIGSSIIAQSTLLECPENRRSHHRGKCSIGLRIGSSVCQSRSYAFGIKSSPGKAVPTSKIFKRLEALEFSAQSGRNYNACTTQSETISCQAEQGETARAQRILRYQNGEAVYNGPARIRGTSIGRDSLISRKNGEMPAQTIARCKRRPL